MFDDIVNVILEKMEQADGLVVGTPVYYAPPTALFSRCWTGCSMPERTVCHEACRGGGVCRRAGTTASLDVIQKYFTISQMPIVSSQYWNMVHGNTPEQVLQDKEGLQIMRTLGNNMAWLLQCIEAGKKAGIEPMREEKRETTNFIR